MNSFEKDQIEMHEFLELAKSEGYSFVLVLKNGANKIKYKLHKFFEIYTKDWETCGIDRAKSLVFKDKKENNGSIMVYHENDLIGLLFDLNDLDQYLDFDIKTFSYKSVDKFLNVLRDNVIEAAGRYTENVDSVNADLIASNLKQEYTRYNKFVETVNLNKGFCRIDKNGDFIILKNYSRDNYLNRLRENENI